MKVWFCIIDRSFGFLYWSGLTPAILVGFCIPLKTETAPVNHYQEQAECSVHRLSVHVILPVLGRRWFEMLELNSSTTFLKKRLKTTNRTHIGVFKKKNRWTSLQSKFSTLSNQEPSCQITPFWSRTRQPLCPNLYFFLYYIIYNLEMSKFYSFMKNNITILDHFPTLSIIYNSVIW